MRIFALAAFAPLLCAQPASLFRAHLADGQTALQQSRYAEADRFFRMALQDQDAGPDRVNALEALCDLDLLVGKYAEAIDLQEKAVTEVKQESALPPHLIRLAGAYRAGGKATMAEPVLLRVLSLDTAVLGPDDPKIATDFDSLASVYSELRDNGKARDAWTAALASRVRRLGEEHLDVATNYVNLGFVEEKDLKLPAARSDYEKALAIAEKKAGEESYSLTGILDRLGLLLRSMKNFKEAEPILQRSLAIREKTLGSRHSEIAPALDNLAMTYFYDSKYAEAEPLFTRSLQIWILTQGPYSPLVARALDNLGALYSSQQRYEQGEPFFRKALAIHEREDIESLANLALIYASKQDAKRAEIYFQRAILIGEKSLGGDHTDEMAEVMEQYATFLTATNRTPEGKKALARSKELRAQPHLQKATYSSR